VPGASLRPDAAGELRRLGLVRVHWQLAGPSGTIEGGLQRIDLDGMAGLPEVELCQVDPVVTLPTEPGNGDGLWPVSRRGG